MKDFSQISWVWLDLDDTLIDFHANSRAANRLMHAAENLGRFYADPEEWIRIYEAHNRTLWEDYGLGRITQDFLRVDRFATPLRPRWDADEASLERFSRRLDEIYLSLLAEQTAMVEGAREFLGFLRAHGYNIGVLSNGFKDVQHRKLANTGLDRMIDLTVLSDDIGVNKPDRRLYVHAMERSGETAPGRHMMIGDNRATDIAGALGAGWQAVLLDPSAEGISEEGGALVTPRLLLLESLLERRLSCPTDLKNAENHG